MGVFTTFVLVVNMLICYLYIGSDLQNYVVRINTTAGGGIFSSHPIRDMIIALPMRYPFKASIAKIKVIMPVMRTYVLFLR